jgi:hypothetical protein
MRKGFALLLIAVTLMVVLVAVGCGSSSTTGAAGDDSPEAILAAAIAASDNLKSATGSFEFTMSFDVDTSQMSEEEMGMAQAFTDQPTKVSGTFAASTEPQAADVTIALDMAGETTDLGAKIVEDKVWIGLLDQWYETPPELQDSMQQSSAQDAKAAEMMDLMSELGIDPVTWLKDAKVAGEEKIDGTAVYRLTGSPDVAKMMTDVIGLMQSEEFMALVDPSGTMGESTGLGDIMPTADELQETQTQLADVFKDFVVELWIAKDTSLLHKASIVAHIVPPADQAAGMNAIDFSLTVSLQNINKPVTVQAPASALPYTELEKAMQENPEMFGPFMGIMGGGMTGGSGGAGFDTGIQEPVFSN